MYKSPIYFWVDRIDEPAREACLRCLDENFERFSKAAGSSHNHQAWPGGYLDHIDEAISVVFFLYDAMSSRELPFSKSDATLVLFLHDIEKPWKEDFNFKNKQERRDFRNKIIEKYKIPLTETQKNALLYVEGEGDDYSSKERKMNELAAFCHVCDVISARIWYDYPKRP